MSGQLFNTPPEPPRLSSRQQAVHEALKRAGHEGMGAAEAGMAAHAHTGKHPADQVCGYCVDAGNEILRALRKKGLARYTLKAGWLATDAPVAERPAGMTDKIPY